MLNLTSAMSLVPFLFVAAYGFLLSKRGETCDVRPNERTRDLVIAAVATIYTIFLLYAGGLKFIVLSAVLYAPGTALYFWARREQSNPVFTKPSVGSSSRLRLSVPASASTGSRPATSPFKLQTLCLIRLRLPIKNTAFTPK
jgi:amino acid transporter